MGKIQPLCEVLAQIVDPREASGQRYPFPAILNLVCAALLCGYDNPNQMAMWGQAQSPTFLKDLGFPRGISPRKSQLYNLLGHLKVETLEAAFGQWAESVLQAVSGRDELEGVSVDGKTLRGSKKQGAAAAHLLSAVSHRLGLTLHQVAVDDKTNEIPLVEELLKGLVLEGRVFTMDALLTQQAIAQQIVEGGGDYLMAVKGNQAGLYADIEMEFRDISPSDRATGAQPERRAWSD
jgi:DDE_Tnp_1-associated/Transposase DDE domain